MKIMLKRLIESEVVISKLTKNVNFIFLNDSNNSRTSRKINSRRKLKSGKGRNK